MALCNDLKSFSRRHEHVADFFSLLAVGVLFASIWASLEYYEVVMRWVTAHLLLHGAVLIAGLLGTVALILALLAAGSARFGEDNERCFGTFQGRRSGGSPISALRNWLLHIENVGKRHR
jgi:hypothetical protein